MKARLLMITISLMAILSASAQRLDWKPSDFAPLTAVPWDDERRSMPDVLKVLFQEPDVTVRYPMLAEYLREIPVADLESAFRLSVVYEGTQHPRALISLFLRVWAERDPEGAWRKAKKLLEVALSHNILDLARWDWGKVAAANQSAFQKSSFWIKPEDVAAIGPAIEASELRKDEKIRILKEYAAVYIDLTGSMPPSRLPGGPSGEEVSIDGSGLVKILRSSGDWNLNHFASLLSEGPERRVSMVRCLSVKPELASKLVDSARDLAREEENGGRVDAEQQAITLSFLSLWAQLDRASMEAWAKRQNPKFSETGMAARGILLEHVTEESRKAWLAEADRAGYLPALYACWAEVSPVEALKAGSSHASSDILSEVHWRAAYPTGGAFNRSHWGLGALRDFDIGKWQTAHSGQGLVHFPDGWSIMEVERWLQIDVGEAARYAYSFITSPALREQYPRSMLIKVFSGKSFDSDDDGALDRTFCGMRFWAMWKPEEMRKWISGLEDPEMRQALTWMVENPWGWNSSEDNAKK